MPGRFLAAFILLTSASGLGYSQSFSGMFCQVNTPAPLPVKVEGITELVSDFVFNCYGGTPTPLGANVPTVNITIALNTQITSRILDSPGSQTDALLLINEPGTPTSPLTPTLCPSTLANGYACNVAVVGTGYGGGKSIAPYPSQYTNANIYQGVASGNFLTFFDIPIDPPGSVAPLNSALTFRITNLRANGTNFLPLGSSAAVPIEMAISTSVGIAINYSVQIVGNVESGLAGKIITADAQIQQCSTGPIQPAFTVSLEEGYASSLLTRFPGTISSASIPGNIGLSTSGFVIPGFSLASTSSPGVADFGTRIKLTFGNTEPGVTLYVPLTINSGFYPPNSTSPSLTAVLTSSETGPFSPVAAANGTSGLLAAVTNNEAVYEVVTELPASLTSLESLSIPVSLSISGSPGSYPSPVTGTVQVDFAPSSTVVTATTGPIPRYAAVSQLLATYSITACPVANFTPYSGTPQTTVINTAFAAPLQALLKDSNGNAVSNSPVTFTLPTFGPGALFAGGGNVSTAYSNARVLPPLRR